MFPIILFAILINMSLLNNYSLSYEKQYQKFNYYLAEHCDNFYYINDIIHLENFKMNEILTVHLMDLLLQPIYADSLIKKELLPYNQVIIKNINYITNIIYYISHINISYLLIINKTIDIKG